MYQQTDSRIQTHVLELLALDPKISGRDFDVAVDEGRVRLRGAVASLASKQAASQAAHCVEGVWGVDNELEVSGSGASHFAADLAASVRTALLLDSAVPPNRVQVRVDKNTVFLSGIVDSHAQAEAVAHSARGVEGVRDVLSFIVVSPPVADAKNISATIMRVFERDAAFGDEGVEVEVEGGHAMLWGTVATAEQRMVARDIASHSRGVADVSDHIEVVTR